MENLDIQASNHKIIMEFNTEILDKTLEQTRGENTMPDNDMKYSIVVLMGIVQDQEKIIQTLIEEVKDLKNKKPSIKDFFKR